MKYISIAILTVFLSHFLGVEWWSAEHWAIMIFVPIIAVGLLNHS